MLSLENSTYPVPEEPSENWKRGTGTALWVIIGVLFSLVILCVLLFGFYQHRRQKTSGRCYFDTDTVPGEEFKPRLIHPGDLQFGHGLYSLRRASSLMPSPTGSTLSRVSHFSQYTNSSETRLKSERQDANDQSTRNCIQEGNGNNNFIVELKRAPSNESNKLISSPNYGFKYHGNRRSVTDFRTVMANAIPIQGSSSDCNKERSVTDFRTVMANAIPIQGSSSDCSIERYGTIHRIDGCETGKSDV